MNSFISGSADQSIIRWIQINNNEWKWSQPYSQHTDVVLCLILNKQEDQLISGSLDKSIKIWNVDFIKNKLTYLYSLDNTEPVSSASLNQSETMFVLCAFDNYKIWKKGVQNKWEFTCKSKVTKGYQIYFINDQQFLWVTCDKNIDQILILNCRMEYSNRIKIKPFNQIRINYVRIPQITSQLYIIKIKTYYWLDINIIFV